MITLQSDTLQAHVLPEVGGALARFDWIGSAGIVPLMRPSRGDIADADPNRLACYPMVPWCNRIGGGAFEFDGTRFEVARNRADEPYPIHGDGWLAAWDIAQASSNAVTLVLERGRGAPFSYRSELRYCLDNAVLEISLSVTNRGPVRLPFGLGVHPWFERTPGVRVEAATTQYWASGPDLLPTQLIEVPNEHVNNLLQRIADRTIDNSFVGWNGLARVTWPERQLSLTIRTSPPLRHFVLYAPVAAPFFCFEPMTHPINAINLDPPHRGEGLIVLDPGQRGTISVVFEPHSLS